MLVAPPLPRRSCTRSLNDGNGSIDSMPLNAYVTVATPKISPKTVCQRFWPRYGMLVGAPAYRYFRDGEYIHIPMTTPRIAEIVPMPDDQITTRLHSGPCLRSGVK